MNTLVHITHEAHEKMGGIGAVLEGLLTTRAYQNAVDRTILVGNACLPLARPSDVIQEILYEAGGAKPSAALEPQIIDTFKTIESTTGVRLLYARRAVPCPLETRRASVGLLLIDVRNALAGPVNTLKGDLWQAYALESQRFENDWSYEEWVRLATPALEAIAAILGDDLDQAVLISHEFMGLPTVLAARLRMPGLKTIYWAHEVPAVRDLIEQEAGQRLIFDQAMETHHGLAEYETRLRGWGGFKHALVTRAARTGCVFAVSDRVANELRLLSPDFAGVPVEVVYNGLPVRPITPAMRRASRDLLARYAEKLVGFRPDFVFTHVARPVASKAIERDLAVLDHLDDILADRGQRAVLLVLATDGGRRDLPLIRQMESDYAWPYAHRVGWPDLVKGEVPIGQAAEQYNGWRRATRAILINQFGFSRQTCGDRVPEELTLQELRQGSDVEFGQSSYEPFGIAQLETLAFGGISVITSVCGCAQLLARVAGDHLPPNILVAHYGTCPPAPAASATASAEPAPPPPPAPPITEGDTRRIEHEVAARLAKDLAARLPTHAKALADLLESGWALAEKMSWQSVCREFFIPALERCLGRSCRRPSGKHPARRAVHSHI